MINAVKKTFERTVRAKGFRQEGGTWYYDCPETILVLNLQKSQYGPSYYINLGVWVKALGDDKTPKEHQCHVRTRLTSVTEGDLDRALDLDSDIPNRESVIESAINDTAIPFLKSCSTLAALRSHIIEGAMKAVLVQKRVRTLLGV